MTVKTFILGMCMTNCYIVSDDVGNCVVIDPADNASDIYRYITSNALELKAILLTHGHFDHIYALTDLVSINKNPDLPVYIHINDAHFLTDVNFNLSDSLFETYYTYNEKVITVTDGESIDVSGMTFKVMHTPGHTPGSVCYITEDKIFSGDTLFASTIGRTDFPGGDYPTILKSLKKFKALSGDYSIFPGHNAQTTLNREKMYNEYMQL